MQSGTPSPSVSVSATPQPQIPGAIFNGSLGQPSSFDVLYPAGTVAPPHIVTVVPAPWPSLSASTYTVQRLNFVLSSGAQSHTSPILSPSASLWSLINSPFDEQPVAQSASLVQLPPGLSEFDEQVPRLGPLGFAGQLSCESGMPSLSVSTIIVVVVVGIVVVTGLPETTLEVRLPAESYA
jgi:hypothetical protein